MWIKNPNWMRKRLMIFSFKGYYYGLHVKRRVKWNITLWLTNNNVKCTTRNIQQLIKITNDIWPRFQVNKHFSRFVFYKEIYYLVDDISRRHTRSHKLAISCSLDYISINCVRGLVFVEQQQIKAFTPNHLYFMWHAHYTTNPTNRGIPFKYI